MAREREKKVRAAAFGGLPSLPEHNLAHGCNFAATFSVWDKLFGTFARAPHEVPPTGLFHDEDPPGNPWKFAYAEWVKLLLELKRNRAQHWGMILFGPADYEPPISGYSGRPC